jgi:hypothetical protein
MTDTSTPGTPIGETTVRARFRRVMQVKAYETAEAEVMVEETFPGTMSAEDIISTTNRAFATAKSQCLSQLGLGFSQDEETGAIMETFTHSAVVAAPAASAAAPEAPPDADSGTWDKYEDIHLNPKAWFDNRDDKRNPKGPDFSHSSRKEGEYRVGLWLNDKNLPEGWTPPAGPFRGQ